MKAGLAELEQWCIYATEEVCINYVYFFYYYDRNNMLAYWLSILEMIKSSVN
jgi:hypothetical protein